MKVPLSIAVCYGRRARCGLGLPVAKDVAGGAGAAFCVLFVVLCVGVLCVCLRLGCGRLGACAGEYVVCRIFYP